MDLKDMPAREHELYPWVFRPFAPPRPGDRAQFPAGCGKMPALAVVPRGRSQVLLMQWTEQVVP